MSSAANPVVDGVAGRQHEDRRPAVRGPKARAHLEPVDIRQPDVEHNRVVRNDRGQLHGRLARGGAVDAVPLLTQPSCQDLEQPGGILDHQHAQCDHLLPLIVGRRSRRCTF